MSLHKKRKKSRYVPNRQQRAATRLSARFMSPNVVITAHKCHLATTFRALVIYHHWPKVIQMAVIMKNHSLLWETMLMI